MNAQQLKNSVLQMAVQGKLVPQDPNAEPAKALLEKIKAEKAELIKQKKIKADKNPSHIFRGEDNLFYETVGTEIKCIQDEIPFDIPDSWEWVRLGEIVSLITDGTHKTPVYTEKGIPFLSVQNISGGDFNFTKLKFISEKEHETLKKRVTPQKDDVLFCRIGTLGKAIKNTLDFEFSIFVSLGLIRLINTNLADYIILIINSPVGTNWIQKNKVGGGTHTYKINLVDIPQMLIPLPPLEEQKRIVEKVQSLQPLIAQYAEADTALQNLEKSFPENLKKSLLQWAVQGKLVPQDPNAEPAQALLEKIKAEKAELIKQKKIKGDKNPSHIFRGEDNLFYETIGTETKCIQDEIPFDIPDSWEWVRLGEIVSLITDGTHKTPVYTEKGIPFLSVQNISGGDFNFTKLKFISEKEHETLKKRVTPQKDDVLFCRIGTLGKAIKNTLDFEFSIFVSLGLIRLINTNLADYIILIINSPVGTNWIQKNKVGGGTHTYKINLADIPQMLIPLPPLEEQKRITQKLETLKTLCTELEREQEIMNKLC